MAKIAFLLGKITNIGGIPRVVSLLTNSLVDKTNHEIIIIAYEKGKHEGYNWNSNIRFYHLLNSPTKMKYGIFKGVPKLRKILKAQKSDILISCGSLYGPLGVLATRFNSTKLVYWDHSNYFENTSHQMKIESKNFTAKFADIVVPLTKTDKKNYKNHTKAKEIIQIYNPIDPALENLNHKYDVKSKKIISVGRLTNQKNFMTLVDVAHIVLHEFPDYEWHIYGSGPDQEKINTRIIEKKLEGKLILKGQSDNLYSLYKEYSMMVMTSIYEGFPMTLLEGMANGLPLVSFDIPTGPNEIITDDKNGYLIEPFDIERMAEMIMGLLTNESLRINFSTENRSRLNVFNNTTITRKWDVLFNDLTSK
ncbi:glycosyltransferase family 4 protein [Maribacter polysiphoniae]|uniref:glycosyltransferase family 4 protein n=1 Tax=Maribacter polysiphoniae TaxID=429344 RepID=UPI0023560983|nr:glycosyltransferase family 4 protein [Maribacter polysiphoniae]